MFWGLFNHSPPIPVRVNRKNPTGTLRPSTTIHIPAIEDDTGLRILKQSDWAYVRRLEANGSLEYIGTMRLDNAIVYRYYLVPPD